MGADLLVREVDGVGELDEVSRLLTAVWDENATSRQVTTSMLRALSATGNYVAAAFTGETMVGASVAFFAPSTGAMHSHITGVDPTSQARSIGYALKVHQRDWAAERDIRAITWTFDPLIRRNAYFNLVKLGARATAYLPDFYGPMNDGLNRGDETDRLMISWPVDAASRTAVRSTVGPVPLLRVQGEQIAEAVWTGGPALVPVPEDIERLRVDCPDQARAWRSAVRQVLAGAMADGAVVAGFERDRGYLIDDPA